ncbi:hypothetical protein Tco_0307248 [Tanacetum coccineum]
METKDTLSSCSNSEEEQMQQIQDKAKKELHGTMFLNMDQLEKQLDNEEFQEIGSMASFKIPEFRDTLMQHMESVKKSIDERAHHKQEYDNWKAAGWNQKSRIQAANKGMMHMLMMQISDPYMMKSQWLRWKPTGKIFKIVGLRWVPTRKIFTSRTTKVDSKPTNGSNDDITNQCECDQTLNVIAEHPSDTYVFIVKMEILLEPTSNKLLVQMMVLQRHSSRVGFITTCSCSKTYYKHQDSRIMKAQDLKTKTSANSDIQDLPSRYQVYQGRLLTIFQDDAKYEHVGQDTDRKVAKTIQTE